MMHGIQFSEGPIPDEFPERNFMEDLASPGERPDARVITIDKHGAISGHVALWWKETPEHEGSRVGAIGGFHAATPDACGQVLDAACERLTQAGCRLAVGPMNGNTWRRHRFIIESNGRGSYFMETRHPAAWPCWWRDAGFSELSRYRSAALPLDGNRTVSAETMQRLAARGVTIRPLDMTRFDDELKTIFELSLTGFPENFLYTPIEAPEFFGAYGKIRPHLDPDFVRIAERDGRPCGFVFCMPDLDATKRGEKPALIVKTLAVDPASRRFGLGSVLVDDVQTIAHAKGYREAIHATQNETNNVSRITGRHAATWFRRYGLFAKTLPRVSI
ncbi:MAG: GNAT family N-acetyltransferase [Verrucomicrobiota bacterium]